MNIAIRKGSKAVEYPLRNEGSILPLGGNIGSRLCIPATVRIADLQEVITLTGKLRSAFTSTYHNFHYHPAIIPVIILVPDTAIIMPTASSISPGIVAPVAISPIPSIITITTKT